MKPILIAIVLCLTGCATQTSQQRFQMLQMATQVHPYVLPAPQSLHVPQTRNASCYTSGAYTNCTVN